jgi:excisionase family DNA binding protein
VTDDVPRDTSSTSQTPVSDTRIDLSTWLTKPQAAAAIGVSTKAIERFTQAGKLEQRFRPQAHGPKVAVYFPDDVQKLVQERRQGATPFVLPAGPDSTTNGNGQRHPASLPSTHISEITYPGGDPLRAFAAAVYAAVMSQTSQAAGNRNDAELEQKMFLTLPEASAITGLTQAYLRRAIEDGTLKAIKDRGWRIRRKDLETL